MLTASSVLSSTPPPLRRRRAGVRRPALIVATSLPLVLLETTAVLALASIANRQLNRALEATGAAEHAHEVAAEVKQSIGEAGEDTSLGRVASQAVTETVAKAPGVRAFLHRPLSTLLRLTTAAALLLIVADAFEVAAVAFAILLPIWRLTAVLSLGWAAALYVSLILTRAAESRPSIAADIAMARVVMTRLIGAAAILATLSVAGLPLSGILAAGGVGGVVVGLAVQKVAADAITGASMRLRNTVREGDHISCVAGTVEGTVVSAGISSLRLLTTDGSAITIPYSAVGIVFNHSQKPAEGVEVTFTVAWPQAQTVCERLEELISSHPKVLAEAAEGALRAYLETDGETTPQEIENARRGLLLAASAIAARGGG